MGKFHSRDGLHFERREDGAVAVTIEVSGQDGNGRAFSWPREYVLLDANTWASAVASVSAYGENGESFRAAELFHAGKSSAVGYVAGPVPVAGDTTEGADGARRDSTTT